MAGETCNDGRELLSWPSLSLSLRDNYLISCSNLMHHFFITFTTFLYMFRATLCSSSGGFIVYIQHLVICMSLFLGDRSVHRQVESSTCLCTERSPKKTDIQRTRCCMYTMNVIDVINKWCIRLEHEIEWSRNIQH
jgi:hypothetical protein